MNIVVLQFTENEFEPIRKTLNVPTDVIIWNKTEVRQLSILAIFKRLRAELYDEIIIFCDDIGTDRRLILFKLFLFLAKARKRKMVDITGKVQTLTRGKFVGVDLPNIIWRFILSYLVVAVTYMIFIGVRPGKENR